MKPKITIEVANKANLEIEVTERIAMMTLNYAMALYVQEQEKNLGKLPKNGSTK